MSPADAVPEGTRWVAELGRRVDLQEIRLASLRASSSGRHGEVEHDAELDLSASGEIVNGTLMRFVVKVEFHGVPVGRKRPTVTINGDFELTYTVDGEPPPPEQVEAFGPLAIFTAFPYVRELIHTLTMRLGLPPLTLGVFRLPINL